MNKQSEIIPDFDNPDFDENPHWTAADLARALPADEVHPARIVHALVRGPQRAPTKQQVTLRLDLDVLAKFRATGPGWQARINAVLKGAEL
ncbi:BrnA antitoxin family protein [uncultured Sphingomonas sp.]|uniref:BrnA antitoxin family protein n=1 Tax=uncultured Sphingomonas sp. TaxID=158754 RepID=UPI0035CBB630